MQYKSDFQYKRIIPVSCFIILLWTSPSLGQRAGGVGAKGGGLNREKPKEEKPVSLTLGPTITTTTVDPNKPKPLCDPNEPGTCPGNFTLIYGFTANARPRRSSGTAQTQQLGYAFQFYVTRRLWFEIDNDNVVARKVEGTERETGFGDVTVNAGYDLVLEKGSTPAFSLVYAAKLPSASTSKGIGTGEIDHLFLGVIGKTLGKGERTYVELDVGDYLSGRTEDGGYDHGITATGILVQTLDKNKKYKLRSQLNGFFPTSKSSGELYTLNYIQYKLNDHVALRFGGRIGLTANSPRYGLYLAVKFDSNLREISR
jgi:hypothetical protein